MWAWITGVLDVFAIIVIVAVILGSGFVWYITKDGQNPFR